MTNITQKSVDVWLATHGRTLEEFIYVLNHATPDCEEARNIRDFAIFTIAMLYGIERFYNGGPTTKETNNL